jgi:hypothetical protein
MRQPPYSRGHSRIQARPVGSYVTVTRPQPEAPTAWQGTSFGSRSRRLRGRHRVESRSSPRRIPISLRSVAAFLFDRTFNGYYRKKTLQGSREKRPGSCRGRASRPKECSLLPTLRGEPIIDVLADLILGQTVPLLDLACELISVTVDDVEIVISELTPLFLHSSLICFQFPSTRFQSIDASSESEFCWKHRDAKLFRRRNL